VTSAPIAHVGGLPIEETLASVGPALLVGFGVARANLRARLRRGRSRVSARAPAHQGSAAGAGRSELNGNSDDASGASPQRRHTTSALHPGGTAPNHPRRATPLLLAANASVRTCTEFTPAADDQRE
jgi:hypothetical protein